MSYLMQKSQVIFLRTKKTHTENNILIGRALCTKNKRNTQNNETPGNSKIFFSKGKNKPRTKWANWNGRKGKAFCCLVSAVLIETVLFFVNIEILGFSFFLQIKKTAKHLIRHYKLTYICQKRWVYLKSTRQPKAPTKKTRHTRRAVDKDSGFSSPFWVNKGRR